MSLLPANIRWLTVEASTRCNAWCPACPRNQNGFGLKPGLVETDLPTNRFLQVLNELPPLVGVQFCGNYGDPVIAGNFLELVDLTINKAKKIQIHTNGSLRNTAWWKNLAVKLSKFDYHDVWFGIDGLSGTHEIYRQATDFNRIIENAKAFIDAGGYATWQFIPFKHNEHEIKKCIKLSQDLGFKKFKIVKSFRSEKTVLKHWKSGEESVLEPADVYAKNWITSKPNRVLEKDCMHLNQPGVYLSAQGIVSPCCYLDGEITELQIENLLKNNSIADMLSHKPVSTCLKNCGSCSIGTS